MTKNRLVTRTLSATLSLILYLGAYTGSVQAAPASIPNGSIRISPAITQLTVYPGQNTVNLEYTLSNLTTQPISVALSTRDFGALSQNGSISLYSTGYNPSSNPHGIQAYTSFPLPNVTIAPHSSDQVRVDILNAAKLAPGGHYGAILFSPESVFASAGSDRVNLETSVAGIVFLTTATGGTMNINANLSHISSVLFSLPGSEYVAFSNTGNTQTVPQGQMTLYGLGGKVLGAADINTASGLVLPEGSRIFNVTLPPSNSWYLLPGIYHVKLTYKDSGQTAFKTIDQSFIYINWLIIALFIVIVLLAILIVRRGLLPLLRKLRTWIKKKRTPPTPPVKPNRPPRLIQA